MEIAENAKLLTAEEMFDLPQNERKAELIKGEIIYMAPTGGVHGVIGIRLGWRLGQYVEQNDLGVVCAAETGFVLEREPDTVRTPDVSFISKDKIPETGIPEKYWNIPPELAVEVLSPSECMSDVLDKVNEYFQAGTKIVWVIVPKTETVIVYRPDGSVKRLTKDDEVDGEDVVTGFRCPINEIFL